MVRSDSYTQFLVYARGSAHETMGRYRRLAHWLDGEIVKDRVERCAEIIRILTATIKSLRTKE